MPLVVTVGISSQHVQLPGTCGHVSLFCIKRTKWQLLGNDYPEESPHFPWFLMAHVRWELNNTLKICIAIRTELLLFKHFPRGPAWVHIAAQSGLMCTGPKQTESITIKNICMNVLFFQANSHPQLFSFLPPAAVLERGYSAPSVRHPSPKADTLQSTQTSSFLNLPLVNHQKDSGWNVELILLITFHRLLCVKITSLLIYILST